jgi:hypothetical protein
MMFFSAKFKKKIKLKMLIAKSADTLRTANETEE